MGVAHREKRAASLADMVVQWRWVVVVPILLPISFLFYQWMHWRSAIRSWMRGGRNSEDLHSEGVRKVQGRVRERHANTHGLICTARPPWLGVALRNSEHKRASRFEVDLSHLSSIVWIDTERRVVKCEPMVCMAEVSAATLPLGLAPEVLPELDDLTVGGVINGYGIEGSSHIFGLFAETCTAFEIVVADGSVVRATADNEHAELFHAIPWSHGSLGLLVGVEFRLIAVKDYMRVTYTPVHGDLKQISQAYIDAFCPADLDQDNPEKVKNLADLHAFFAFPPI